MTEKDIEQAEWIIGYLSEGQASLTGEEVLMMDKLLKYVKVLKTDLDLIQAIREGQGLMIRKLHEKNKCYREALEFYEKNMALVPKAFIKAGLYHPIMEDGGQKARKALEESKWKEQE